MSAKGVSSVLVLSVNLFVYTFYLLHPRDPRRSEIKKRIAKLDTALD